MAGRTDSEEHRLLIKGQNRKGGEGTGKGERERPIRRKAQNKGRALTWKPRAKEFVGRSGCGYPITCSREGVAWASVNRWGGAARSQPVRPQCAEEEMGDTRKGNQGEFTTCSRTTTEKNKGRKRNWKQNLENAGRRENVILELEMLSHLCRLKGKDQEEENVKDDREEVIGEWCWEQAEGMGSRPQARGWPCEGGKVIQAQRGKVCKGVHTGRFLGRSWGHSHLKPRILTSLSYDFLVCQTQRQCFQLARAQGCERLYDP